MDAAKEGQVDLILAGLTSKSRWKKDVAFTRPYVETRAVVGTPGGRVVPGRLRRRAGGGRARHRGGGPARAADRRARGAGQRARAARAGRPAAVPDYLLDDLDLTDSGTELDEAEHVMAVKLGENAFLVRLERFLLDREDEIAGC